LGECYQNGNGCKQDIEKAKYWYKKGAEGGSKYAIEALSSLE
ncbi:MAG: SEL1-like repeat protein, partial [Alistipes sp.]|nr:SEL1-like repeat protein [Alistipes sp.]